MTPAQADTPRPCVAVLAHSVVAMDPRVRRQAQAFAQAGYRTVVLGQDSDCAAIEGVRMLALPAPRRGRLARLWRVAEKLPARAGSGLAVRTTRAWPVNRSAMRALDELAPDLLHANDWPTLPVASWLRRRHGTVIVYDSHEYAPQERADSILWRLTYAPHIRAVESACIGDAQRVITVSEGIARQMAITYGLARRPRVIRNVPDYQPQPWREPGHPLVVLYHGLLNSDRGLDTLLDSIPSWKADRSLVLRGPGPDSYLAHLRRRARRLGIAGRVRFESAVPAESLITRANEADVGIHPIAPLTYQTNYCLPNKIFEYVMAGLCLCVSPAVEMARLVRAHDLGVVAESSSAEHIAEAVNSLTPEHIAVYKRNALEAAKLLCWEHEKQRLLALYAELLGSPPPIQSGVQTACVASGPR